MAVSILDDSTIISEMMRQMDFSPAEDHAERKSLLELLQAVHAGLEKQQSGEQKPVLTDDRVDELGDLKQEAQIRAALAMAGDLCAALAQKCIDMEIAGIFDALQGSKQVRANVDLAVLSRLIAKQLQNSVLSIGTGGAGVDQLGADMLAARMLTSSRQGAGSISDTIGHLASDQSSKRSMFTPIAKDGRSLAQVLPEYIRQTFVSLSIDQLLEERPSHEVLAQVETLLHRVIEAYRTMQATLAGIEPADGSFTAFVLQSIDMKSVAVAEHAVQVIEAAWAKAKGDTEARIARTPKEEQPAADESAAALEARCKELTGCLFSEIQAMLADVEWCSGNDAVKRAIENIRPARKVMKPYLGGSTETPIDFLKACFEVSAEKLPTPLPESLQRVFANMKPALKAFKKK